MRMGMQQNSPESDQDLPIPLSAQISVYSRKRTLVSYPPFILLIATTSFVQLLMCILYLILYYLLVVAIIRFVLERL